MPPISLVAAVCLAFLASTAPAYAQSVEVVRLPGDIQPFEDQVFLSLSNGEGSESDPLPTFPRGDRSPERLTIETITIEVNLPLGQSPEVRYDTARDGATPLVRQLSLTRQGTSGSGADAKARWTATLPVRLYVDSDAPGQSRFLFMRSGGTLGTASATVTASGYITPKP